MIVSVYEFKDGYYGIGFEGKKKVFVPTDEIELADSICKLMDGKLLHNHRIRKSNIMNRFPRNVSSTKTAK